MAIDTHTNIATDITTNYADNTAGDISAADQRSMLTKIIDSTVGYRHNVVVNSSPTTLDADDVVVLVDASGGAITINLPAIASNRYKEYWIKATSVTGGSVTIDGNASETIDGATTQTLSVQYKCIHIIGGTSEWHIIADNR